jgi:hypothetical protein
MPQNASGMMQQYEYHSKQESEAARKERLKRKAMRDRREEHERALDKRRAETARLSSLTAATHSSASSSALEARHKSQVQHLETKYHHEEQCAKRWMKEVEKLQQSVTDLELTVTNEQEFGNQEATSLADLRSEHYEVVQERDEARVEASRVSTAVTFSTSTKRPEACSSASAGAIPAEDAGTIPVTHSALEGEADFSRTDLSEGAVAFGKVTEAEKVEVPDFPFTRLHPWRTQLMRMSHCCEPARPYLGDQVDH